MRTNLPTDSQSQKPKPEDSPYHISHPLKKIKRELQELLNRRKTQELKLITVKDDNR